MNYLDYWLNDRESTRLSLVNRYDSGLCLNFNNRRRLVCLGFRVNYLLFNNCFFRLSNLLTRKIIWCICCILLGLWLVHSFWSLPWMRICKISKIIKITNRCWCSLSIFTAVLFLNIFSLWSLLNMLRSVKLMRFVEIKWCIGNSKIICGLFMNVLTIKLTNSLFHFLAQMWWNMPIFTLHYRHKHKEFSFWKWSFVCLIA